MLNIILVDDEVTTLDGLSYMLKKSDDYQVIRTFQKAEDALEYIQNTEEKKTIDTVITDVRMNGMNGIELTREIHCFNPEISVIVLSGYSDFELVRQCMKYGAMDYLLKPCSFSELNVLLSTIEAIKNKRLLFNSINALQNTEALQPSLSNEMINHLFQHSSRVLGAIIYSSENDILESDISGFFDSQFFIAHVGHFLYLFYKYHDESLLLDKLNKINVELKDRFPSLIILSSLNNAVLENDYMSDLVNCQKAVVFLSFNEKVGVFGYQAWHAEECKPLSDLTFLPKPEYLSALLLNRKNNDFNTIWQSIIQELLDLRKLFDPAILKNQLLRIVLSVSHNLNMNNKNDQPTIPSDFVQMIQFASSRHELADLLKSIQNYWLELGNNRVSAPRYILDAISFINNNYMHDIHLKDVAERTYINEWYLSSQFKKYCGISFSEFLSKTRIEAAKKLLQENNLKLWQISEKVGIHDNAYFTTIFKKFTQMTPKEYQKMNCHISLNNPDNDSSQKSL